MNHDPDSAPETLRCPVSEAPRTPSHDRGAREYRIGRERVLALSESHAALIVGNDDDDTLPMVK